jgi:hypothetical protein
MGGHIHGMPGRSHQLILREYVDCPWVYRFFILLRMNKVFRTTAWVGDMDLEELTSAFSRECSQAKAEYPDRQTICDIM